MAHGRPAKCHTSDRITDRPSSSRQRYTELECSDWVSSPTRAIKVSLLHSHLQGVNFQRCKCASGSNKEPGPAPSTWGMRETAACRPSPAGTILQFHHLPPPLPPLGSNASSLFTWGQPLYASYCTVLLYFAGEANGNPLQYSCLENPRGRGAWQATVHGVTRVGHDLVTKPPPPPPLYFSKHCTVRSKKFSYCVFFRYYLCEKYYKPITVLHCQLGT